jgi:hypothetical protein
MPTSPLNEIQARHVFYRFRAIHQRLEELESLSSQGLKPSPFSKFTNDLAPPEVQDLLGHFESIRAVMLSHLDDLSVPIEEGKASVRWAIQTSLMQIQICIDDMGPENLKSYGPLDSSGRTAAIRIQDDLSRLLDHTRSALS